MNEGKIDQNGITKVKMTMALIDINKRLIPDLFEMKHEGLGPTVVPLVQDNINYTWLAR